MKKEELMDIIDNKVNEIFFAYQKECGIETGDISPWHSLILEDIEKQLANLILVMHGQSDKFDRTYVSGKAFTDEELNILSDAMLCLIRNTCDAQKKVYDSNAIHVLGDLINTYSELNTKVCSYMK